jgi:predicted dehydrogenase
MVVITGLALVCSCPAQAADFGLITLDPGHFHAALFQKEMLAGVSEVAHVYAPLGPDLVQHLARVARFNQRPEHPTHWRLEVHAGPDFLERMLAEKPGHLVVLSGRNDVKLDRIQAAVKAGLHVLADKPWIVEASALPRLEETLDLAARRGVVIYDAMTERFEITCLLQRALVRNAEVFGAPERGSPAEPAVRLASSHFLLKQVAGVVNPRPPWFFDIRQQGEGLADVGTHLVEHSQWVLFPEASLRAEQDLRLLQATRWPTTVTLAQFQQITGEPQFPSFLGDAVRGDRLDYFCNDSLLYTLRGIHVKIEVTWNGEPEPGAREGASASFKGTRATIETRPGADGLPQVFVTPNRPEEQAAVRAGLGRAIERLRGEYPGLGWHESNGGYALEIPSALRVGHEAHFASVGRQFLDYARRPGTLPAWEKAGMVAKYFVTTRGVELARQKSKP